MNDSDSGCGMSSGEIATQDFADLLNSDDDEDDWDPWRWYEDVNDGYPVLDGIGVGDIAAMKEISLDKIGGVDAPVRGAVPAAITETASIRDRLMSPADNPFAASTVYTATITLTPKAE
jgi:hypothetical protein